MSELLPLPYATGRTSFTNENDPKLLWTLVILHWLLGVLYFAATFGLIRWLLLGIYLLFAAPPTTQPNQGSMGFWLVTCCGALVFPLWAAAILNAISGIFIKRRRFRIFTFVIAGLNCINFPVGTTLGIFTIIVLSRRSVEELYRSTART